jgi:hypothetical protein
MQNGWPRPILAALSLFVPRDKELKNAGSL